MDRAKDLNGLLTILVGATQALNRVLPLLNRLPDNESQIQTQDLRQVREELETAGRDLAGGLVDLRELPFDKHAWELNFNETGIQLASESEMKPFPCSEQDLTPIRDILFDLGEAPDLLEGIDTSLQTPDDTPTIPLLENL